MFELTSAFQPPRSLPDPEVYGNLEHLDPRNQLVTYWHPYTGVRERLLSALVDEFNQRNEWDIVILAESLGNCDDLHEEIMAYLAAGKSPSATSNYPPRAAAYAAKGALVPLDHYVVSPKWGYTPRELLDFFPPVLAADHSPQFEGWYGWPIERSTDALYYNKDWLAELGYSDPPETWEAFAEIACAAVQQPFSDSKGEGKILGYEQTVTTRTFATFLLSGGADIATQDGTAYSFNSPEAQDIALFLQELHGGGCGDVAARTDPRIGFSAGRVLFAVAPIHQLTLYREEVIDGAGFEWDIVPLPRLSVEDAPRMHVYGLSQSIFRTTPEEQLAAWLFIRWIDQPEQQARWAQQSGYYPVRQSATALMEAHLADNPSYDKALSLLALDYGFEPTLAGYDICRDVLEDTIHAVLSGADVQVQMDDAVARCNASLLSFSP
jgi:multiple sugar transport system substrate-binding protein/sn-glycerol 3-phosphate transport system substrate-binding protein